MGIKTYIEESYNELVNKVSWPTYKDLQSSGIIVMIASLIIALVVLLMDTAFQFTMQDFIYELMKKVTAG